MIRLQILPKIDGIYAPYLVDATVLFENSEVKDKVPVDKAPDYWKLNDVCSCNLESPAVDAVFVSHAHFDHIQDVSFLDPAIPVYCSEATKILAKVISDVSASHVDDQYYEIRKKMTIKQKSASYKTLCPCECEYTEEKETEKPIIEDKKTKFKFTHECTPRYRTFQTNSEGQVKGIKYKMIPVGHSLPGACSILLTLPDGKRILYTGDLRFHGINEISIDKYVEEVDGPIYIMITEGTRIDSSEVLTEENIATKISSDIEKAESLILINFGWKDLTRFKTIYSATKKNERTLVISPKLAYLLYEMYFNFPEEYPNPSTMPNLKVYLKREGDLLYSKADYDKFKMGYLHFHGRNQAKSDWNIVRIAEKLGIGGDPNNNANPLPDSCDAEPYDYKVVYDLATHHLDNGIRAYEIRENPEKYVLMFSYWDANELFDLIPRDSDDHKTQYVCASTEPFNEEMEIDETKFMNWLDFFKVSYESEVKDEKKIFTRKHVSGHASQSELKELIEKINPTKIIPIHTTKSDLFEDLFGGKIIRPKYAEAIDI
jgi:ribonuclease J